MIAPFVGAAVGLVAGLVSERLVVALPVAIEDALEQPAWTRSIRRPPALEVAGVALGVAAGLAVGWRVELLPALVLVALLVPVIFVDIAHRVIPDRIVLPGTLVGLGVWAAIDLAAVPEHLAGAVIGFAAFLLMALASPAGMGMGDVKLALMLGAFLGWSIVPAIVASFLLSLVPSLVILVLRGWREGRKTTLPFGPFLALGGVVGALFGQAMIDLYVGG